MMQVAQLVRAAVAVFWIGSPPAATPPPKAEPAEPAAVVHLGTLELRVVKAALVDELPLAEIMPGFGGDQKLAAQQSGYMIAAITIKVSPGANTGERVDLAKARLEDASGKTYDSIVTKITSCSGEKAETCAIPFAVKRGTGAFRAVHVSGVSLVVPPVGK